MKSLSLVTLLLLTLAGTAHAATLDIVLGTNGNIASTSNTGGPLDPNVNIAGSVNSSLFLNPGSHIINATSTSVFSSIFDGSYLSIAAGGGAIFDLASGENTFGFSWGTLNNSNFGTVLLLDSSGNSYKITQANILSALGLTNVNEKDVSFYDPHGAITTAIFAGSKGTFATANYSQSSVPLPAALPLFGMALLGLVFFATTRRNAKA